MKKLWKYLSAVGLMFVAFLCLGMGLKTGEKAEAAKTYDVYVASGSSYTMSGGTMNNGVDVDGTFNMNGGMIDVPNTGVDVTGTFNMNGGTIKNNSSYYAVYLEISGHSVMNFISGSVSGQRGIMIESSVCNMRGGTIDCTDQSLSIDVNGTFNMYGGTIEDGIVDVYDGDFNYYGGKINSQINLGHSSISLHKEPENVFSIELYDSSIVNIAKLEGISTISLSKLNVTNMPTDKQLEIQTINGETWVVVAEKTYTVTFKTNATITGGGWNIGSYTNANSVTLHFRKGGKISFGGYYNFSNCVEGYNYGTITTPSGYSIDSVKTSGGTSVWSSGYPYPASYEITGNTTITINFKYTITFEAKTGGTVSKTSYDLNAGTSLKFTPNGASLSAANGSAVYADFSGVTATPNSNTYFMYWQKDGTTMTNQTAVTVSKPTKFTAVFSSSTTVYKITIEKSLGTGVYATPNPLFGTFTTYNVGSGGTLRVSGSQLTITPSTGSFSYTVSYTAFGTGGTYTVYFTDSTGFTMSGTYTITSSRTITMRAKRSSFAAEQVDEDNGWQYDVEYVPLPWERGLKRNECGFVEKI